MENQLVHGLWEEINDNFCIDILEAESEIPS